MAAPPRLSVILPTRNGEAELRRLLPALGAQALDGGFELLAIDSESSDGTVALLQEHGADVESIRREEFEHGRSRNRCAERARGELLVFLSQDVVPVDDRFLSALAAAFDDPRMAGSYARVLPHPDDDPLTARTVLELPEASEEPSVRDLDAVEGLWRFEPEERARYLRFNNVASAVRTDVFREIPLPPTSFGEDFAWAARALTAGWRIAFVPEAAVYHAHDYDLGGAFRRYRVDAAFHAQIHGWRMRPNALSALRGFLYEVGRDVRYLKRHRGRGRVSSLLRSPGLRAAQVWGQYLGSRGNGPRIWRGDP